MNLVSPTKGFISLEEMVREIHQSIKDLAPSAYKVVVGSDSQNTTGTCFVTAITIYIVGKGARYFYCKQRVRLISSMRQRIYYETSLSLEMALMLKQMLENFGLRDISLEIHLDVGNKGKSGDLIKDVVGMVVGSGFPAKIKPDSYGACTVADKFTR